MLTKSVHVDIEEKGKLIQMMYDPNMRNVMTEILGEVS